MENQTDPLVESLMDLAHTVAVLRDRGQRGQAILPRLLDCLAQRREEYAGVFVFLVQIVPYRRRGQRFDVACNKRALALACLRVDEEQLFVFPGREPVHQLIALEHTDRPGRKKLGRIHKSLLHSTGCCCRLPGHER